MQRTGAQTPGVRTHCISNIRPEGISHHAGAFKLARLLEQAFLRRLTSVKLKDESDNTQIYAAIFDNKRPDIM